MNLHHRALGFCLLAGVQAGLAWMLPLIAQPPAYHDFADQGACRGLPKGLDTASNALFMLAGALGLRVLYRNRGKRSFRDRHEAWPYRLFFLGAVLIGFGSGYYHLDPDNNRWLWDRLAIMLTFMAWVRRHRGRTRQPAGRTAPVAAARHGRAWQCRLVGLERQEQARRQHRGSESRATGDRARWEPFPTLRRPPRSTDNAPRK